MTHLLSIQLVNIDILCYNYSQVFRENPVQAVLGILNIRVCQFLNALSFLQTSIFSQPESLSSSAQVAHTLSGHCLWEEATPQGILKAFDIILKDLGQLALQNNIQHT